MGTKVLHKSCPWYDAIEELTQAVGTTSAKLSCAIENIEESVAKGSGQSTFKKKKRRKIVEVSRRETANDSRRQGPGIINLHLQFEILY